mmetsp:Transcript_2332/g.3589  ORF Transcript_2332/g.3589 Transcript_2332/m.3589 type:complete len:326 (-) Transcript_2332:785-1762(-)
MEPNQSENDMKSFMFINGVFYVSTLDSQDVFVMQQIYPIIDWLQQTALSNVNHHTEDGSKKSLDEVDQSTTAKANTNLTSMSSSFSTSATTTALDNSIGMKQKKKPTTRKGPLMFASHAQALLAKATDTDREVKECNKKRKMNVADDPRQQAVYEAVISKLNLRPKLRYEEPRFQHIPAASNLNLSPASSSSSSSPPHSTVTSIVPMLQARIVDVGAQMGARYLYCHHDGACEHFLYVTDLRLRHRLVDDAEDGSFPKVTAMNRYRRRKCCVCDALTAKFVVYGDRLLERSPSYLCQQCYFMLHYSQSGQLLYDDYRVYPYLHDA